MTHDAGPEDLGASAPEPLDAAPAVDAAPPLGDEGASGEERRRRSSAWPWIALAMLLLILIWLIWQYVGRTPAVTDVTTTTTTTVIPVTPAAPDAELPETSDTDNSADTEEDEGGVPDVIGMTKSAARAALSAAGYSASVTTVYGDSAPANTVIHQNPSAGSVLSSGNTVGITVQRRTPEKAGVPNFVGLSRAEATRRAKAAGFKVVISYTPFKHGGEKVGAVNSQWPPSGESQEVGGDIQLQIVIKP